MALDKLVGSSLLGYSSIPSSLRTSSGDGIASVQSFLGPGVDTRNTVLLTEDALTIVALFLKLARKYLALLPWEFQAQLLR